MNDDQLSAELRRRAGVGLDRDWARHSLVPAVNAGIDSRPAPVVAARWSPMAGLVGVVAVLLLLVVAVPRLTPGQGEGTPAVAVTPPSTIGGIGVRYFQQRLATGELNGHKLLVNGRIEADLRRGPMCDPSTGPCYLGTLLGTEPPLDVVASAVPTTPDDPLATRRSGDGWEWWSSMPSPVEGVLVLSVDEEGQVEFIGRNPPDEVASAFSELQFVDVESLPLEEVRVVPAWLGGHAPASCPAPDPSIYIDDLPERYCGGHSWIASQPLIASGPFEVPDEAIHVQNGAYDEFAPDPVYLEAGSAQPRAGTYVLARRLEGSGCPQDRVPCWQWNLVGRLTLWEPTDPAPIATPTDGPLAPTPQLGPPTPETAPALTDMHQQGDFVLTLSAGSATYSTGESLDDVVASLAYVGTEPSILLGGSGSGLVGFGLDEVHGDRDLDGPVWTMDCASHSLVRDQPTVEPYQPSGGFGADDPNADFYREFFRRAREGEIVLPEGSWRLSAVASFNLGPGCNGRPVGLEASIIVDVVADRPTSPDGTHLESAWWEIAAHERPTAGSTTLEVVVYELACTSGEGPDGRILEPDVEYAEEAVTITFSVRPLPDGGDCQMAPGAPVTVQLQEPLGDRRLVDGGTNSDVISEAGSEMLVAHSPRVEEMGRQRLEAMAGSDRCIETIVFDRDVPTQLELEVLAIQLGGQSGLAAEGAAYLGDWLGAARAFGAIEAYEGLPKPWYFVAPAASLPVGVSSEPDALVLASLDPFPISGSRTIWYPAFYQATIASPGGCVRPSPTPAPPEGSAVTCPYDLDAGRPAEISIVDHSGLVIDCDAFVESSTPAEFVRETNVGSDQTMLEVRWEIPEVCSSMPVQIGLWGPLTYEPPFGLPPPFVLQIDDAMDHESGQGCWPSVATQGVRLALRSTILTERRRGLPHVG